MKDDKTQGTPAGKVSYYNFRTGQSELLAAQPADWSDFIPQGEAAQNLYWLYQEEGDAANVAAIKVLRVSLGLPAQEDKE